MAFDRWNGSVCVVIAVGMQTDVAGAGRHPGGDQHGVQAASDPVGPLVRPQRVVGLQGEAVFDGDEVERAALGFADQVSPVTRRQQFGGPGVRLAPRRRVPTRPVERDGEMEKIREIGHGAFSLSVAFLEATPCGVCNIPLPPTQFSVLAG